jgi:hypothetical protein
MPALAENRELVGFFSYSREDDVDSKGALSALRDRIQRELRGQLGRSARDFRLWQDKEAIAVLGIGNQHRGRPIRVLHPDHHADIGSGPVLPIRI